MRIGAALVRPSSGGAHPYAQGSTTVGNSKSGKRYASMILRNFSRFVLAGAAAATLAMGGTVAAQDAATETEQAATVEQAAGDAVPDSATDAAEAAPGYEYMGPEMIKGQPEEWGWTFQPQHTDAGEQALTLHNAILMPVIVAISLFVLVLLLLVIVKYRRGANPKPSRTTHNTMLEVVWTIVPALILLGIAIPSINLIRTQYKPAPADAITVKATGWQWYWTYSFPDNGEFEITSNMMDIDEAEAKGLPSHLAVDNRLVLPVGVPIRLQTTAADVIHSFAIPSLWFKLDAVPGRINEKVLTINEPGIYYGQCSELCGARHGYMPIAIEAVPMERWEQWVLSQGGTLGGDTAESNEAAPLVGAASASEDAAPAGEAPIETTSSDAAEAGASN